MQIRDSLEHFSEPVAVWFRRALGLPTAAQRLSWPPIASGESTLLLAPTGSGKTLAAFLAAIDRLMFHSRPAEPGVRVLYVSPLKALGSDVEKNLVAPIAGIAESAVVGATPYRLPTVAIRTGDTAPKERTRQKRDPPDILITTPESLYLLLTSAARETLRRVDTVIIDEIHALVPTKRGAHLALSLERLEWLRDGAKSLQRIGLSATQRPLQEVSAYLGGNARIGDQRHGRPVTIVDAGRKKALSLSVELPWADAPGDHQGQAYPGPRNAWEAIQPRLVELISAHRSTLVFVNNRGLTERLASALNEIAGQELCLAHHGSISKERRVAIEDSLKRGNLRAVIATSSLELGIDVGAVDLVVQIEAPPSISSALQRVGRSGHSVGLESKGVVFPKHRADLLSCAAVVARMREGAVEATHFPRNPLDVLAQQIVAAAAVEAIQVDELFERLRCAAPFSELSRVNFEAILDMLSGRWPSDEFAELRARLVWDRARGVVRGRQGTARVAVTSGGTIADRGLFGVYVRGDKLLRVGELDEEMVFESRVGDVFVLGATSWRIEEITFDRVYVVPAPAEAGRMPFWHGDGLGRPAEFGRAIGQLTRSLLAAADTERRVLLCDERGLTDQAASELWKYISAQRQAIGAVPTDTTVVVEKFLDEVGDYRVCVLSPYGSRVHAPWALAVEMHCHEVAGIVVESTWHNDGIVLRVPDASEVLDASLLFPDPEEVERLLIAQLGHSALFAARFRENAARSLLLPRGRPGRRTPLWAQRKRAARLLQVASKYPDFPIVLETYRECLKDVFDIEELQHLLAGVSEGAIEVRRVESQKPSPFSSSLLFAYAGNFVYERDIPAAERRAQVLTLHNSQLRALLGEAELRQLIDPECLAELSESLSGARQSLIRHPDGLADALLAYGDLELAEIEARATAPGQAAEWLEALVREGRAVPVVIAHKSRFIAVEDAARYRDALGVGLPEGLPETLLAPVQAPLVELVARFARCHVPFLPGDVARRFGIGESAIELALCELERQGRVEHGEFLPHGTRPEWCDVDVLRLLKRWSLEALRRQIEPVEPARYSALVVEWQHISDPLSGMDGLLDAVEQLTGVPINLADLESEVLGVRVRGYEPRWLDELVSAGEIIWRGFEPIGQKNGRIALYLSEQYQQLAPPSSIVDGALAAQVRRLLGIRGALFFHDLAAEIRAFPPELLTVLWSMIWAGEVTNDTFAPLRSLQAGPSDRPHPRRAFRPRRAALPGSEGRWSLLPVPESNQGLSAKARATWAEILLKRQAIVTRESASVETLPGGFSSVAPLFRALEERSRARRGYFVAGLSGQQYAAPMAVDRLRRNHDADRAVILASTDPANLYGGVLPWPEGNPRPQRIAGAKVVLRAGRLLAFANKDFHQITTFFEVNTADDADFLARALVARASGLRGRPLVVETVDAHPARATPLGLAMLERGFTPTGRSALRLAAQPPSTDGEHDGE